MHYEIEFLPVGDSNGDALYLRYGDETGFWVHVVDGGFTDTAATVINHIRTHDGANGFINHMGLSHADNDHACGLPQCETEVCREVYSDDLDARRRGLRRDVSPDMVLLGNLILMHCAWMCGAAAHHMFDR